MSEPSAAQRFGRFTLREVIGGSMGIVYRARADGDAHDVALKVLRHERLLDGEARVRFVRELRALAKLSHPNICPLLESGEIDGIPFFCMPLLPGPSLAQRIAARDDESASAPPTAMEWRVAVELVAAVADALHAAHGLGIVHRDVKPSNIVLGVDGAPVLVDFGLARDRADRYRHLTRSGQLVGTPAYLAPEQLEHQLGPVDRRADVYGAGAVLYELLLGAPPFTASSKAQLFERILNGPPPDLRALAVAAPADLSVVIDTALARRVHHRYQDAAALAADLRRVLAGVPIVARRPRPGARWWRRAAAQPRRVAAAVLLMATALLLMATALLLLSLGGEIAEARDELRSHGERIEYASWSGRLATAQRAFALLPPPRQRTASVLRDWLREHGEPLLAVSLAVTVALPELAAFVEEAVADVRERLALAETMAARSLDAPRAAWLVAQQEVAADPRFAGFALSPQCGLVPLGSDPLSGLQEFYDLASGDPALAPPVRDDRGLLQFDERHGIVFVLLPGGRYTPCGHPGEVVELAPFLLAKHELTRAQWRQLDRGRDDSRWPLGVALLGSGEVQTLRHPVEQVRFAPTLALLQRWGYALPTEVQWGYAARAGGAVPCDAVPVGNLAGGGDGFTSAAPVGAFDANPFGLCDMWGNVAEMVADALASDRLPARPGDGLRDAAPDDPQRTWCGGHFGGAALARYPKVADQRWHCEGLRPIRAWEPGKGK